MSTISATIWEAAPHTLAKHLILRHYLNAWFPILCSWNGRVVYFDGFAGPGRYKNGEKGSPLIAIESAKDRLIGTETEIVFLFSEIDDEAAGHLRNCLESLELPDTMTWHVLNQDFGTTLEDGLNYLDKSGQRIAPTFAFIDPFGITGLPFRLIKRLLERDHCEVLITFMGSRVRRWATELQHQIDDLIGFEGASQKIAESEDRLSAARQLYCGSLQSAARFVRYFEMRDSNNSPIYDLFFATNSAKGHYKMKYAMWKADENGTFRFSDGVDPSQQTLFSSEPVEELAPVLMNRFSGQTILSDAIFQFVQDETPFLDKHTRAALKLLEINHESTNVGILVEPLKQDQTKRRNGYFTKGTIITFSPGDA